MQQQQQVGEVFWCLVQKADKKFSKITHIPFYHRNRQDYDAYFYKVFKVYTQLWKFQQENRHKLVESGLSRGEIGEIASRIAQLYFGQYMRSSQPSYLREAYVFYDAILSRDYFASSSDPNSNSNSNSSLLASKHLRFLSRFLTVCLLLNRRHTLHHLLSHLRSSLDHFSNTFHDTDFREWKQVVQELVRFLKYDSNFMNIRPLRYSVVLDPDPESLKVPATNNIRTLWLRDAVLSSYHHNEVKFSELTLDTFRMLQCLEWESSGAFYQPSITKSSQNGSSPSNRINHSQDIADPSLPPNPRKAVLYRPTVTHFLAVVATVCEELPSDGVLLIYLSASGTEVISNAASSSESFVAEGFSPSSRLSNNATSTTDAGCLWFGTRGNEGLNCIYPSDLLPFTRKPVFLVVDGDNNDAFEAIHGSEKGETVAILLSPTSSCRSVSADSRDNPGGSLFTVFLTTPIQAFCLLIGNTGSTIDMETYFKAENLLSTSMKDWGSILVASDSLHPVWAQILGDPFLRRLILRFVFCRAVLALYRPSSGKKEFVPRCVPNLPEALSPVTATCRSVVMQIAKIFGATSSFMISEGVEYIQAELESMSHN